MAKTKPVGVRFNEELLKQLKKERKASTPQQALIYYEGLYEQIIKSSEIFDKQQLLPGHKKPYSNVGVVVPQSTKLKDIAGVDKGIKSVRESPYLQQRRQMKSKNTKS